MIQKFKAEIVYTCLFCDVETDCVVSSIVNYEELGLPNIGVNIVEEGIDEICGHLYSVPFCPKHEDACTMLVEKRAATWTREVLCGNWSNTPNLPSICGNTN